MIQAATLEGVKQFDEKYHAITRKRAGYAAKKAASKRAAVHKKTAPKQATHRPKVRTETGALTVRRRK